MLLLRILLFTALLGGVAACGGGGSSGSDSTVPSVEPAAPPPPANDPPMNNPPTNDPFFNDQSIEDPPIEDPLLSQSPVAYRITPLGSAGGPGGSATDLNGAGDVIGASWIYRSGARHELGWGDFDVVVPEDALVVSETSTAVSINDSAQVLGSTELFWLQDRPNCAPGLDDCLTGGSRGRAWLYNDGSYVEVGRAGAGLTHELVNAGVVGLNEAGEATGSASWGAQNEEGFTSGEYAWLYSNGASRDISLLEETHRGSRPWQINEAGDVIGTASGTNFRGSSCWLYSDGTTYPIGRLDREHSAGSSDRTFCFVHGLNEFAQVIGNSTQYSSEAGGDPGDTAWLYSAADTINVGLLDAAHTDVDGRRESYAHLLNNAGQVAGRATRYGGGGGQSVWFHDKGETRPIGLSDPEHTGEGGVRASGLSNYKTAMNDAGQVIGYSVRYTPTGQNSNAGLNRTTWLYGNGMHTRMGLSEAQYTAEDGTRFGEAIAINQAGQVVGYSNIYLPGVESMPCFPPVLPTICAPRTAWYYDHTSGTTFPLTLSTRSDGYQYSDVFHLSESGVASGYYMALNEAGERFEWRMFQYSPGQGLADVVIEGTEAWDGAGPPSLTHDSGHFVGSGQLARRSELTPFLLTPLPASEGTDQ